MVTITVDDNSREAQAVRSLMQQLEPTGDHWSAGTSDEALRLCTLLTPDAVLIDLEFPEPGGGLGLARQLLERQSALRLVFFSGTREGAFDAFQLFADGYLLKPVTADALSAVTAALRRKGALRSEQRLRVRCFGDFEVYCGEAPVKFQRRKTKELFAYLIDRDGAMCTNHEIVAAIWPEERETPSRLSQLRTMVADMQTTFTNLAVGPVLCRERGALGVEKSLVDCDYYKFLNGDSAARELFQGQYMNQYPFADATLTVLTQN